MINDIIEEIINHLSPISIILFSMTNKNNYKLCCKNKYYQRFNQNKSLIACNMNQTYIINKDLYMCGRKYNGVIYHQLTLIYKNVISVHCNDDHCIFFTKYGVYCIGRYLTKSIDEPFPLPISSHDILFIVSGGHNT